MGVGEYPAGMLRELGKHAIFLRRQMNRLAVFGGLSWKLGESLGLAGELYSTPADAVTLRLAFGGTF